MGGQENKDGILSYRSGYWYGEKGLYIDLEGV